MNSSSPASVLNGLLNDRHSCRAFLPDTVPREVQERLLQMAQRTASWCNSQPWQVHITEGDEWVELDEVEQLAGDADHAELFIYPGSAHLVADSSLDEYDEDLAELIIERSIQFLDRLS